MSKVLLPSVKVRVPHELIASNDTLLRMDDDELYARIRWLKDKARDILTSKVDSKAIDLLAEIRETAKIYAREAMRTQMIINTRNTHFNGHVLGKQKPTNGRMVADVQVEGYNG